MAKIGRMCKEYMIKELSNKLKDNSTVFVTDCTGLSVLDLGKLRATLKGVKASYLIIKSSMGKLALKNVKQDSLVPFIEGTIGFVLGGTDPILTSKTLLKFSKESGKLRIKGAMLDGELVTEAAIKEISQLSSREALLAKVFGSMKAPIRGFVNGLQGIVNKLVYVINAIKEKKGAN